MSLDERPRVFVSGQEARSLIRETTKELAHIVKKTLGPSGKNALVDRGYRAPRITNDGVFIAKSVEFEDPLKQVVARQVVEVAERTNDEAGDGTTTSITLTDAILKSVEEKNSGGILVETQGSVIETRNQIKAELKKAQEILDKMASPAKDHDALKNVAKTSLEDEEFAGVIADMVIKMGEHGHISVVEGFSGEVETETLEGMQFDGKLAHQFMANTDKKKAVLEDASLILTNHHIESPKDIVGFVHPWFQSGKKELVIMAPKFSMDVIMEIAKAKNQGFYILAVKIPALTDEQIDDISAYTNAVFYNKEKGSKLDDIRPEGFGRIGKIEVDDDKVILIGGDKEAADKRIQELKSFIKVEKDELFRKKYEMRIASLASAVGIIKVAQGTEAEKGYVKLKIEDAVFATKAAFLEGVVPGGGEALRKVAKELGKDSILFEALEAPYKQIQENAGGNLKIPKHVVDPVKVTKAALSNACAVASMLLTTDTVVAIVRPKEQGDSLEKISNSILTINETIKNQ